MNDNKNAHPVVEFTRALRGRHAHLCWPYRSREPRVHREWRTLACVLQKARLYAAADLPIEPGFVSMLHAIEGRERRAFARWLRVKHSRAMQYLTGKRKTPPPESCF
jgi:hypothetical protein